MKLLIISTLIVSVFSRCVPDDVPTWVQGDPEKSSRSSVVESGRKNALIVHKANENKFQFDLVLYGDSITAFAANNHTSIWNAYFGENTSAPLGVGGDNVQELSWRIAKGRERLVVPPKVVGLLIGVNNIRSENTHPSLYLDSFLLSYLKNVYPTSEILLIGLLPNTSNTTITTDEVNEDYERLANAYQIHYADISEGIDPYNEDHLYDGLHPAADGYEIIYEKLRSRVEEIINN